MFAASSLTSCQIVIMHLKNKDPDTRLAVIQTLQATIYYSEALKRTFEDLYGMKAILIIVTKANSSMNLRWVLDLLR